MAGSFRYFAFRLLLIVAFATSENLFQPLTAQDYVGSDYFIREFSYRTDLPSRDIRFVIQNPEGEWCFGTGSGLLKYNGTFFSDFFEDSKLPVEITKKRCKAGFFYKTDLILMYDNALYRMNAEGTKIKQSLSLGRGSRFAYEWKGHIYIVDDKGINILDIVAFRVLKRIEIQNIWRHLRDANGGVYLVNEIGRVFLLQNDGKVNPLNPDEDKSVRYEVIIDFRGHYAGTRKAGSSSVNPGSGNISDHIAAYLKNRYVQNTTINDPLFWWTTTYDKNNILWYVANQGVFAVYKPGVRNKLYLAGQSVRSAFIWGNGNVLASTYTGLKFKAADSFGFVPLDESVSVAWSGFQFHDTIFLQTEFHGLYVFDIRTLKVGPYFSHSKLPETYCNLPIPGSTDRYLFGKGMYLFSPTRGELKTLVSATEFRPQIFTAYALGENEFLLGCSDGIYKYYLKNKDFKKLAMGECRVITKFQNQIIAGTLGGGLLRFVAEKNDFVRMDVPVDKATSIFYYSAAVDAVSGSLWLGTSHGIIRYRSPSEIWPVFTETREYNTGLIAYENNDRVWMGGISGLELIDFKSWKSLSSIEKAIIPFISQVKIYNRITGRVSFVQYSNREVVLGPDDHSVQILVGSGLDIVAPVVQYRYRIIGYDNHWNTFIHSSRTIPEFTINRIPAGTYDIQVQVRYSDGSWSYPADLILQVKVHWYQTTVFKVFLFPGLFMLIFLLVRWFYQRRLKDLVQKQEKRKLEQSLTESELNALRNQIEPHFLANTMQAVSYFIYQNDKDIAVKILSKYSAVMRMNFEYSDVDLISLAQEIRYLQEYSELSTMLQMREIKVEFDFTGIENTDSVLIPSMMIQPFVENVFKHGFKNAPRSVQLMMQVAFYLQMDQLVCTIWNNGNPFEKAGEKNGNSGNKNVLSRLQLYGEMYGVESGISYVTDETTTLVKIVLPSKQTDK